MKEKKVIPEELVFIWVGSNYHHVDSIAPKLGHHLAKKYKIRSMFCNGQNIEETKQMCLQLRSDKSRKFQFIAVDITLNDTKSIMVSVKGGLKPSNAVKEQKIHIGDIGYAINVSDVYNHVKDKTPMECLLEDYYDDKVRKKVNRRLSRMYVKFDTFFKKLQEVSGGE